MGSRVVLTAMYLYRLPLILDSLSAPPSPPPLFLLLEYFSVAELSSEYNVMTWLVHSGWLRRWVGRIDYDFAIHSDVNRSIGGRFWVVGVFWLNSLVLIMYLIISCLSKLSWLFWYLIVWLIEEFLSP